MRQIKAERLMYFSSKVFKGAKARYQNIEKLELVIIVMARKLRPYFQGHKILVKNDYLIRHVLKNLDLEGKWYHGSWKS